MNVEDKNCAVARSLSNGGLGVNGIIGHLELPKMDGKEIEPGIFLIGEPSPAPGNKFRCLAQVGRSLCVVELSLKILTPNIKVRD